MAEHYNVHEKNRKACIQYVQETISSTDAAAQLAEECTELAQACLKLIRAINKTNPTPVTEGEALASMEDEFGDVLNAAEVLGILPDPEKQEEKMFRWTKRLIAAREEQTDDSKLAD